MRHDVDFDQFFVKVCEDGESWTSTDFVDDVQENRLPLDLLASTEAETCFRNHVNALQAARRKEEYVFVYQNYSRFILFFRYSKFVLQSLSLLMNYKGRMYADAKVR
jgi:hypothetical protein